MKTVDFAIIGSSGGGGTIAWLLAKAGFSVTVLELGPDFAAPLDDPTTPTSATEKDPGHRFIPVSHDEYRFRLERPDPKRRPRGDYNTFREAADAVAKPFDGGWTASILGGGSIIWGTWAYRALPIDFVLEKHFKQTGQLGTLNGWGYSVVDWPVTYSQMEPFYNIAEVLLAAGGDRPHVTSAIKESSWYKAFGGLDYVQQAGNWAPKFPFPGAPFPRTPVGDFFYQGAAAATPNFQPVALPSGIVTPGSKNYSTREKLREALTKYDRPIGEFWGYSADKLWSDTTRSACNMCGFCGEFLCWGQNGPKSGTRVTTLQEMRGLPNAEIRTNAKAYEVMYDQRTRRATGVRYLDISDPDHPRPCVQSARHVIVSCGAVQTARLLLMSGPPAGLGNSNDLVGRHAMFHLFGLGIKATLPKKFQGLLHGEFAHTGNTTSFEPYFIKEKDTGLWWKAGTMTSTAKKNPLENANGTLRGAPLPVIGRKLLQSMEDYNRALEVRLTADDLPMARNRVDLDPTYVDEYGFPVARITRAFGPNETKMFQLAESQFDQIMDLYIKKGIITRNDISPPPGKLSAILKLIGDHQMGTCRMGDDPNTSVVDRNCRMHEVPNVFVVDSSFFPTGFGLNPMVTVVANALRVGTWITEQASRGGGLS